MCGITGYIGKDPALSFVMQGIQKLEYRGYDSAGVTLVDELMVYLHNLILILTAIRKIQFH